MYVQQGMHNFGDEPWLFCLTVVPGHVGVLGIICLHGFAAADLTKTDTGSPCDNFGGFANKV